MTTPARMAVFASGGGTNLQALIDRFNADPRAAARVELVVASRPGIGAIERAERADIPTLVLGSEVDPESPARVILQHLDRHRIELIVLAGYLRLVPPEVVARYHGRMLNIHPALLPAFGGSGMYGMRVHRAVIESGAKVSGATVHLVGERYDEGPIVAQWPVPVLQDDSPETLAARILRVEHILLPIAIETLVGGGEPTPVVEPAAFDLAAIDTPAPDAIRALAAVRREQRIADNG